MTTEPFKAERRFRLFRVNHSTLSRRVIFSLEKNYYLNRLTASLSLQVTFYLFSVRFYSEKFGH